MLLILDLSVQVNCLPFYSVRWQEDFIFFILNAVRKSLDIRGKNTQKQFRQEPVKLVHADTQSGQPHGLPLRLCK